MARMALALLVMFNLGCDADSSSTATPPTTAQFTPRVEPSLRVEHQPDLTLGNQTLRLYSIECTGVGPVEAELVAVVDGRPHPLITVQAQPDGHDTSRGQLLVLAPDARSVPVDMKLTFGSNATAYTVHADWPELPAQLPIDGSATGGILSPGTTVIYGRGLKERNTAHENLLLPDQRGPDRLLITLRWGASPSE